MSETNEAEVKSTPWHLWLIGVVALLWNAMGAFDYVMTQTRNDAYTSNFTAEQLAFFTLALCNSAKHSSSKRLFERFGICAIKNDI